MSQKPDSLLNVISILNKWKRKIIGLCIIAAVLSVIIALVLPNYYKSYAIFFPVSEYSTSGVYDEKTVSIFGVDEEVDRLMVFANSMELVDHMVKTFDLYTHYNINSNTSKGGNQVRKAFLSLYTVKKNNGGAIELEIEDKIDTLCATMVNEALLKIESIYRRVTQRSKAQTLETINVLLKSKREELNSVSDTLTSLRKRFGIYSVYSQGEQISEMLISTESNLAQARGKLETLKKNRRVFRDSILNLTAKIAGLEEKLYSLTSPESKSFINLKKFNEGRGAIENLIVLKSSLVEEIAKAEIKFAQLSSSISDDIPVTMVTEKSGIPKVKSSPVRWLIVVSSVFITFLFSVFGVLLFENYREVDWKTVLKG